MGGVFPTMYGVLLIKERTFVSGAEEIAIPDDVWRRALRLSVRFGRNAYEYIGLWAHRKICGVI